MFCKYCGKKLSEKAIFCSKCGKHIAKTEPMKSEASNQLENTEIQTATEQEAQQKVIPEEKQAGISLAKEQETLTQPVQHLEDISQTKDLLENPEDAKSDTSGQLNTENLTTREQVTTPQAASKAEEKQESFSSAKEQESNSQIEQQQAIIPPVKENTTADNQEKFGIGNLFKQVFKKHTPKERDEILKAGLSDQNTSNIKIRPKALQPWLYSRVFLVLLAVFVAFEICLLSFHNSNIMPGVMLIGSVMIPFSLLTMYFELNVYKDISFYKTIGIFLLGGAVSLLFTLFLFAIIPEIEGFSFINASLISITEEVGKAAIVIILLKRTKNATPLQGLLIGGAIGCGFAVFESAGYAFNVYLDAHDYNTRARMANDMLRYMEYGYADSIGEMNFNIFLRSILSFGGHTAWAAIEGAAYAKAKKINLDFIKPFAICFVLHAVWDMDTPAVYFKLTCLCLIAWWVIIRQISKFVEEKNNVL